MTTKAKAALALLVLVAIGVGLWLTVGTGRANTPSANVCGPWLKKQQWATVVPPGARMTDFRWVASGESGQLSDPDGTGAGVIVEGTATVDARTASMPTNVNDPNYGSDVSARDDQVQSFYQDWFSGRGWTSVKPNTSSLRRESDPAWQKGDYSVEISSSGDGTLTLISEVSHTRGDDPCK